MAERRPDAGAAQPLEDLVHAWEAILNGRWQAHHLAVVGSSGDSVLRDTILAHYCEGLFPAASLTPEMRGWLPRISAFAPDQDTAARHLLAAAQASNHPLLWTVLGHLQLWAGDGARGGDALDAALAADPDYTLAQMLRRFLDLGVNPRSLVA